ncbi:hypothetical protein [Nocardiopsis alborubida]|uniref:Uncharacterized protein n=1 Tax=Nocardiopsis alborubida TaxID=146802 RepID=A0A7X6ME84_9ACTN|nr:hypothetical protein [Nocardiopsis alborubida]NKY99636.1 hypothetical protein [Nocardiopsis alborubida]
MSFEPTEPQNGVDPNPFTLIDPDTIPYPLTDVWSLNYAAETLRTGGEDLFGGAEDMSSTWGGLQAHYSAPESETLFAAMDPVVTRGEDVQSDLATVASALEDLAEAATTARGSLNTLRIEAQSLWNANHDKKVWWLTKDDETDEWALGENVRIKDAVNTAWSTFNEAENACASRISAVFGGPAYVSPDQAGGDDALVYGLPTDAGERDMSLERVFSFEGINSFYNDVTAWAGTEFHPSLMDWGNPSGQALWDTVVTDFLWGSAVGLTSKLGFWHPDNGWRFDPRGLAENFGAAWSDAWMDTVGLVGVHDEHGWLWEPGEGGQEGWGAGWDRWLGNAGDSIDEVWEGHTAWSTREDGVAYSNTTIGANVVLMTGGLPLKLIKIVAGAGVVSSVDTPTGSGGPDADGSGPGSGGGSGSDSFTSRGGPGTRGWPSSPLPGAGEGQRPTGERFENPLTHLNESLLDPNRYRPPSSTPTTPVPDGGGERPSQSPSEPQRSDTPQPQDRGRSEERDDIRDDVQGETDLSGAGDAFADNHRDNYSGHEGDRWPDNSSTVIGNRPAEERIVVDLAEPGRESRNRNAGLGADGVPSGRAHQSGGSEISERVGWAQPTQDTETSRGPDADANEQSLGDQSDHVSRPDGQLLPEVLENWSELPIEIPDGTPADVLLEIRGAIDLVSQVHSFPDGMEPIVFDSRELGSGRMGSYDRATRTITFDPSLPNMRETLVHEIGHVIDNAMHGERTGSRHGLASAMPSTPEMREWASAVRNSPQVRELRSMPVTGYSRYMRLPQELWARSYAQWIAQRTGDPRLQSEIRSHLSQPGIEGYRQWAEDDFRPVASALDAVFENDWKL